MIPIGRGITQCLLLKDRSPFHLIATLVYCLGQCWNHYSLVISNILDGFKMTCNEADIIWQRGNAFYEEAKDLNKGYLDWFIGHRFVSVSSSRFFSLYFCNIYLHVLRIAVPVLEIIFDHASSSSFCHYPMPMVGACQGSILALVFLCLGLEHRNSRQTVETNLRLT